MAFALKKSFISKLKNITTVASVRTANLTRVRITMASPMQSGAGVLLPCLKQVDFEQAFSGFLPKFLAKNEEEIALLNAHFYFRLIPGTRSITNNIYITHSS